jgi:uncharacterized membrane protein
LINIFEINDWKISRFFNFILFIQVSLFVTIYLDAMNLHIPIIRELLSFIYLLFIPGILILRILKLHKLGNIRTILYSCGLSISSIMFIGFLLNLIYPFLGIKNPISEYYLIITLTAYIIILTILSYIRDKEFSDPSYINWSEFSASPYISLFILPFLAIFGTYLINNYNINLLSILLIIVISIIVILTAINKISKNLYPIVILMISISLLFSTSLISNYLWGYDIHGEYFIANFIFINGFWNPTLPYNLNAMLSIVMFAPIYSKISGMNLVWIFKIVYPLIFSLVPLGLYEIFKKQTTSKIAFFACFFFMAFNVFFIEMVTLARQEIAELFLVLIILLMIDEIKIKEKSFLSVLFAFSLVVSHYGLSYIYLLSAIFVIIILFLIDHRKFIYKNPPKKESITLTFVILFSVLVFFWYTYNSSSSAFSSVVHIGNHIVGSISTDFLTPGSTQPLQIIQKGTISPLRNIEKYLDLLSQFFISIGIIKLIIKRKSINMNKEYVIFCFIMFIILIAGIIIPYFASALDSSRLYQISLIFLAPICIIGGIEFSRIISKFIISFNNRFKIGSLQILDISFNDKFEVRSLHILAIFLVIFFLFNSGLVYQLAQDHPMSISLSTNITNLTDKSIYYTNLNTFEEDIYGAQWLNSSYDNNTFYTDFISRNIINYGGLEFYESVGNRIQFISPNISDLGKNSILYLGYANNIEDVMRYNSLNESYAFNKSDIGNLLNNLSLIYSNGGVQIYYSSQ